MAIGIGIKIEGADKLIKNIDRFSLKVQHKALVPAVRESTKLLIRDIRSRTKVRSGTLRRSIGSKKLSNKGSTVARFLIGPRIGKGRQARISKGGRLVKSSDGWYGRMVEKGTTRFAAKPFMAPAFNSQADNMVKKTLTELKSRLGI